MNTSFERTDASDDWITPPEIMKLLGKFDLDPCACKSQPFKYADTSYTIDDDGLSKQWFGRVWCNPPYGRKAAAFIEKLSEHNKGMLLIFARVETKTWFHYIWYRASGVLFIRGRLNFYRPDGTVGDSAGCASALVSYGQEDALLLQRLDNNLGKFIPLQFGDK